MNRLTFYLCLLALLLPISLKVTSPWWIPIALQIEQDFTSTSEPLYVVKSIHGQTFSLRSPNQSLLAVQLAGLTPLAPRWQSEAIGVVSLLLAASDQQVSLTQVGSRQSNPRSVIMKIPRGTCIQETLIRSGLAAVDQTQLSQLPQDLAQSLLQAQVEAQRQHKNIWGN
jgi:endonuclease YncB( thermonuclease family)